MTTQIGGLRRQPTSVVHLNRCQNPLCGNRVLTKMHEYARCNLCGWDSRMTAEDMEIKFGKAPSDYVQLRQQLHDFKSVFYGPHPCLRDCGRTIIKQAVEDGGVEYEEVNPTTFVLHDCPHAGLEPLQPVQPSSPSGEPRAFDYSFGEPSVPAASPAPEAQEGAEPPTAAPSAELEPL